jgi:hypothetical protein
MNVSVKHFSMRMLDEKRQHGSLARLRRATGNHSALWRAKNQSTPTKLSSASAINVLLRIADNVRQASGVSSHLVDDV